MQVLSKAPLQYRLLFSLVLYSALVNASPYRMIWCLRPSHSRVEKTGLRKMPRVAGAFGQVELLVNAHDEKDVELVAEASKDEPSAVDRDIERVEAKVGRTLQDHPSTFKLCQI